ncbi:MAG: type II toxin-antitoxin system prevent-host-death family antitoxin [Cyclobacteriaceae bacterium]
MKTVGSFDAKTHLSRILEEVANGEEYTITKHGRPVAELKPIASSKMEEWERLKAYFSEMRKRDPQNKVSIDEIIAWKNEGRR